MTPEEIAAIAGSLSTVLPQILAFIKGLHQGQNPGQPQLTDADALAALAQLSASSIAQDEAWKASHGG